MADQEFDKFAKRYDEVLSESIPLGMDEDAYFAEYKIVLAAQLTAGREVTRILDFGCGAGRSLPYLAKYFPGAALAGFDLSPESLRVAKSRQPDATLHSDWSALDDQRFDLIFAANVFHHIPSPEQLEALLKCKGVMSDRGEMIIFEHNPINPATRWVFERCPFDVDAKMLSKREMKKLSYSAQMRLVDEGYTLFFPRQLRTLRSIEKHLSWLPLGAQYYVRLEK
jgi:cyclopropane fatty-acyl-phospholipid synthase-like methyltransferase